MGARNGHGLAPFSSLRPPEGIGRESTVAAARAPRQGSLPLQAAACRHRGDFTPPLVPGPAECYAGPGIAPRRETPCGLTESPPPR